MTRVYAVEITVCVARMGLKLRARQLRRLDLHRI